MVGPVQYVSKNEDELPCLWIIFSILIFINIIFANTLKNQIVPLKLILQNGSPLNHSPPLQFLFSVSHCSRFQTF